MSNAECLALLMGDDPPQEIENLLYPGRHFDPFSDISFGMCWCLMSWVQQVHNAAVVAIAQSL